MYTIEKVTQDIDASTAEVLDAINGLSDKQLNDRPGENSWSAGETMVHLLMLEHLINKILQGNTQPTERDPAEQIPLIQKILSNQEQKLNSPESIRPKQERKTVEELVTEFTQARETLRNIVNATDINASCTDFKHRSFGEMTRLEWVYFNIYHTERHLEQIRMAVRMVSGIVG
ncbi:MAG: hypothetical protein K0R82_1712 [Flavipsychrobacter sp.]|jgi:uncharacterized damage-inducible protein DinB|nr:hypothetical protein [Flavipsychrobacter sp.]